MRQGLFSVRLMWSEVNPLANEPAPEGKARAKELREEIDRILHPDKKDDVAKSDASGAGGPKKPLSPREFIQKRMRELDGDKGTP